jgi:GDP-4-dehydro-6-deoxy-D-mannose reductase
MVALDILDREVIQLILLHSRPDYIMHLAGQSSVVNSWQAPQMTIESNVIGTINILEGVRKICPETRVVLFSTSHEYGSCDGEAIIETQPIQPTSPYGVSKAAQTLMGKLYHEAYGLDVVTIRLFNQIGVGQSIGFVLPDFASQVAKIEKGLQESKIQVGDLNGIRDFTDVEDGVKQMVCVMHSGEAGEIYHIGSGRGTAVKRLMEILLIEAKVPIEVVCRNENRMQDKKAGYFANLSKLQEICPSFEVRSLEETVRNVLDEWRQKDEDCD